eukprot:TRINITY_DN59108_c0_g2_i3.p1 TRINITY_DN59108_c0_g2~~TRINITY_DN59108_c0_g2_i3.p1  ORF type:complete len:225 (-),score=9.22 TRINITY_DN59108_c0_g2_i3:1297-1902(-)
MQSFNSKYQTSKWLVNLSLLWFMVASNVECLMWMPLLTQTSNEAMYAKGSVFYFPWIKYTSMKIAIPHFRMLPRRVNPGTLLLGSCEQIMDGDCGHIDEFQSCGFCMENTYPLKGYGVTLTIGFNETSCAGMVLDRGSQCPMPIDCDSALSCLLECGNQERIAGEIVEIPETCQIQCNSDDEVLSACRLSVQNEQKFAYSI